MRCCYQATTLDVTLDLCFDAAPIGAIFVNPNGLVFVKTAPGVAETLTLDACQCLSGSGAPAAPPDDPTTGATYIDYTNGDIYFWDVNGGQWITSGFPPTISGNECVDLSGFNLGFDNGTVSVNTCIPVAGAALTVNGNVYPSTDDAYDLGSNTNRWRDLYLGPTSIHIGTNVTDEYVITYNPNGSLPYLAFSQNNAIDPRVAINDKLYVGNNINPAANLMNSTQFIGVGQNFALWLEHTIIDSTTIFPGGFGSIITTDPSSDSTNSLHSIAFINEVPTTNSTNLNGELRGMWGKVSHFGTGTVNLIRGIANNIESTGPVNTIIGSDNGITANNTVTDIRNLCAGFFNNAGTVDSYKAIDITLSNTSTINNTYGIYIDDISKGTQTNLPYAIYSLDPNSRVYFEGNVGLKNDMPETTLRISGIYNSLIWPTLPSGAPSTGITVAADSGPIYMDPVFEYDGGLYNATALSIYPELFLLPGAAGENNRSSVIGSRAYRTGTDSERMIIQYGISMQVGHAAFSGAYGGNPPDTFRVNGVYAGTFNYFGTIEEQWGVLGQVWCDGLAGVPSITLSSRGIYSHTRSQNNSSIIDAYGAYIDVRASSGTIDNYYGVFITENNDASQVLFDYFGVYQEDINADNYFAGSTGIGALPTLGKLHVEDTIAIPSGFDNTVFALALISPTANQGPTDQSAGFFFADTDPATPFNMGSTYGSYAAARHTATTNVDRLIGKRGDTRVSNGTVNEAYGAWNIAINDGGATTTLSASHSNISVTVGTVTETSSYDTETFFNGGTIGEYYGLKINDLVNTGSTITDTYGIYVGNLTNGTQVNNPTAIVTEQGAGGVHIGGYHSSDGGLHVTSDDSGYYANTNLNLYKFSTNPFRQPNYTFRKAAQAVPSPNGTLATTNAGEYMGRILWRGVSTSGNWANGAVIRAFQQLNADGSPFTPMYLTLYTRDVKRNSFIHALTIDAYASVAYGMPGNEFFNNNSRNFLFNLTDVTSGNQIISTADYQFITRADGGVYFVTSNTGTFSPAAPGGQTGAYLAPGASAWAAISDVAVKDNIKPISYNWILNKLRNISVNTFSMKQDEKHNTRIGILANEWNTEFSNVITPEKSGDLNAINYGDLDGVALAAIKGLLEVTDRMQEKIDELSNKIKVLTGE